MMNDDNRIEGMGREEFWRLITLFKTNPDDFGRKLERMSPDELIGFVWMFDETKATVWERYRGNETSEDYIDDLCAYVVGQGREFFEKVRDNPDKMPLQVDYSQPGLNVRYAVQETYRSRFGEDLPPL
jgi:hypothetical protein